MRRLAAPVLLALALSFAVTFAPPARAASAPSITTGNYGWIVPVTVSVVTWTCRFMEFTVWVGDRIAGDIRSGRQRGEGRANAKVAPEAAPEVVPDGPPADSTPPVRRKAPPRAAMGGTAGTLGAHAIALPEAPAHRLAGAAWDPEYQPGWQQIIDQLWQRFRRLVQDLIDWLPGVGGSPGTTPPDPVIDSTPAPASLT